LDSANKQSENTIYLANDVISRDAEIPIRGKLQCERVTTALHMKRINGFRSRTGFSKSNA